MVFGGQGAGHKSEIDTAALDGGQAEGDGAGNRRRVLDLDIKSVQVADAVAGRRVRVRRIQGRHSILFVDILAQLKGIERILSR